MTIGDVTVCKVCSSNDCLIGDGDTVVRFVLVAHTLQNFNGVSNSWLFHFYWLETTLECRVFFEVLAILIGGCCTDCLQFTTSKHWLENACGIDCAFSCTSTYKCVDFVDEQNNVATCLDFFQHFLQTLFEVTAVTATCNKCAKVECVQLLVFQRFRNVTRHDALCETFDNCCLTNTRFTDEDRVVLCTTRKNLHDALEFACTTNNWVEFLVAS